MKRLNRLALMLLLASGSGFAASKPCEGFLDIPAEQIIKNLAEWPFKRDVIVQLTGIPKSVQGGFDAPQPEHAHAAQKFLQRVRGMPLDELLASGWLRDDVKDRTRAIAIVKMRKKFDIYESIDIQASVDRIQKINPKIISPKTLYGELIARGFTPYNITAHIGVRFTALYRWLNDDAIPDYAVLAMEDLYWALENNDAETLISLGYGALTDRQLSIRTRQEVLEAEPQARANLLKRARTSLPLIAEHLNTPEDLLNILAPMPTHNLTTTPSFIRAWHNKNTIARSADLNLALHELIKMKPDALKAHLETFLRWKRLLPYVVLNPELSLYNQIRKQGAIELSMIKSFNKFDMLAYILDESRTTGVKNYELAAALNIRTDRISTWLRKTHQMPNYFLLPVLRIFNALRYQNKAVFIELTALSPQRVDEIFANP